MLFYNKPTIFSKIKGYITLSNATLNPKSYYSFYFKRNKFGVLNFVSSTWFQFVYLDKGQFIAKCAKGNITVNSGELLFVPPEILWEPIFGDCDEITGVLYHFRNWPDVDELDFPPQTIKVDEKLREQIYNLPIGEKRINSSYIWRTYRFLDEIQNHLTRNNSKSVKAIQNVLEFMRTNDNYTIPQLVEISGMKKSTFYTVFEELTGSTPVLTKQRFQAYKAEILLSTTDMTIEEIARKTGFNSVAHFRKVFRSRYYTSPKEIRRNQ